MHLSSATALSVARNIRRSDGPSIVDGALYWGSRYREIDGTGNNKVYAFTLDKHSKGQGERERLFAPNSLPNVNEYWI
jgi:hypothetical protein